MWTEVIEVQMSIKSECSFSLKNKSMGVINSTLDISNVTIEMVWRSTAVYDDGFGRFFCFRMMPWSLSYFWIKILICLLTIKACNTATVIVSYPYRTIDSWTSINLHKFKIENENEYDLAK